MRNNIKETFGFIFGLILGCLIASTLLYFTLFWVSEEDLSRIDATKDFVVYGDNIPKKTVAEVVNGLFFDIEADTVYSFARQGGRIVIIDEKEWTKERYGEKNLSAHKTSLGVYFDSNKTIYLKYSAYCGGSRVLRETLIHEIGHYYDKHISPISSDDAKWIELVDNNAFANEYFCDVYVADKAIARGHYYLEIYAVMYELYHNNPKKAIKYVPEFQYIFENGQTI